MKLKKEWDATKTLKVLFIVSVIITIISLFVFILPYATHEKVEGRIITIVDGANGTQALIEYYYDNMKYTAVYPKNPNSVKMLQEAYIYIDAKIPNTPLSFTPYHITGALILMLGIGLLLISAVNMKKVNNYNYNINLCINNGKKMRLKIEELKLTSNQDYGFLICLLEGKPLYSNIYYIEEKSPDTYYVDVYYVDEDLYHFDIESISKEQSH